MLSRLLTLAPLRASSAPAGVASPEAQASLAVLRATPTLSQRVIAVMGPAFGVRPQALPEGPRPIPGRRTP